MGLSASMWTSVSGLLSHGNKMNVVGNNIANVSTIGFKGQRMDFNDYLYINGGSTSGPTQIGAGVSTYAVLGDFSQGSLESTNSVTDIAIDGKGWFKVRQPNTEQMYFTRAGDFYFNPDRQLQNPEGYRLQGWKVDSANQKLTFKRDSINLGENKANESAFQGTGTPKDIVLDSWYIEPLRTNSVSFTMGLTSDKLNDRAIGDPEKAGPMLGLVNQWDARRLPDNPMPDKTYATQSSIKVYDESGIAHELTVYYDQVQGTENCSIKNMPAGYTMYEYIVTIPPTEDMRMSGSGERYADTKAGGLLMTGHMVFDASGNMVNQTAYTYQNEGLPTVVTADGEGLDYSSWKPAKLSSNGLPVFTANFKGLQGCSTTSTLDGDKNSMAEQKDQLIEIDFGLRMTQDFTRGSLADLKPGEAKYITNGEGKLVNSDNQVICLTDGEGWILATSTTNPPEPLYKKDKDGYLLDKQGNEIVNREDGFITDKNGDVLYKKDKNGYLLDQNGQLIKNNQGAPIKSITDDTNHKAVKAKSFADLSDDDKGNAGYKGIDEFDEENPVEKELKSQAVRATKYTDLSPEDQDKAGYKSYDAMPEDLKLECVAHYTVDYNHLAIAPLNSTFVTDNPTKAGGTSFVTQDAKANGYTSGVLSGTNITNDGVVYGYYDNGETIPLYQIALYDFHCEQGLRREGGNLYAATKESGDPRQGVAGDNGFGVTRAYNIEGSNVDMSREFVNMITTQRGFQANSKGITTVDTMLETVIGMKR